MRFAVSEEQQQFAASLHDLLAGAGTPAIVRAWSDGKTDAGLNLLRDLHDLGVGELLVPEQHGGLGADVTDVAVAFEVLGYHAVPGPIVESAVVVPMLLNELGGELAAEWLPRLASGERLATVTAPPLVPYALDADVADLVLRVTGGSVGKVSAAAQVRSIDAARRLFAVDGPTSLGAVSTKALEHGVLAVSAQLLGCGQSLLDAAVEYAKKREQYGRAIGQYQAVKHLLADVATQLELARPLVYGAAVALRDGGDAASRDVSAVKVATGKAAYLAARTALQVHGAIGYTAEHDLGLWLTKVRALTGVWGTAAYHRARVLTALEG